MTEPQTSIMAFKSPLTDRRSLLVPCTSTSVLEFGLRTYVQPETNGSLDWAPSWATTENSKYEWSVERWNVS